MVEIYIKRIETLWVKERLLVTSNFSFSHIVFKRLVLQTRKSQGLLGKVVKQTTIQLSIRKSILYKKPTSSWRGKIVLGHAEKFTKIIQRKVRSRSAC